MRGTGSQLTVPSDKLETYNTKWSFVKIYVKFIVFFSCGCCIFRKETFTYYVMVLLEDVVTISR